MSWHGRRANSPKHARSMRVRANAFLCVPAAQATCTLTIVVVAATSAPDSAPRAATHFTTGAAHPMGAWRSTHVGGPTGGRRKRALSRAAYCENPGGRCGPKTMHP